jgi:hypothetical protein
LTQYQGSKGHSATSDGPKKCRKYSADTHLLACNGNNHFCDSNAEDCYLNLPEDMVEDNPLDLENIKEKQDEDNALQ